jgi:DNA primase
MGSQVQSLQRAPYGPHGGGIALTAGLGTILRHPDVAQISKETIEKVLQSTDIVDLVGSYIELKRAGAQFRANCPFHHEKTPSFYVTPSMQRYKCFGCSKSGDAITFLMEYENLTFVESIRRLATRGGLAIVEVEEDPLAAAESRGRGRLKDLHREATAFFHHLLLNDPAAAHARQYLVSRGFGEGMAERWKIGWMPDNPAVFLNWARGRKILGRELVDCGLAALRQEGNPKSGLFVRFRDRLMFPIRNEIGDVIAFSGRQLQEDPRSGKYINSPETAIFKKSHVLFALDRAKKAILRETAALLCEGQIDAIACHEAGVEHAVAPLGTAFTRQHARLLRRYTNTVLLCYDSDKAGWAASERAFREIAAEGLAVRVIEMPAGDDPDSYLKSQGAEGFRRLITEAIDFFEFKLMRARDAGLLENAGTRATVTRETVELLAAISDATARDHEINVAATFLRSTASALREAIAVEVKRPKRFQEDIDSREVDIAVEPTRLNHIVAYLCHLAMASAAAQHFLGEQFETLHQASQWVEGVSILEQILGAAPDPSSPAAINAFLFQLTEPDRLALMAGFAMEATPEDGVLAAEQGLSLLSATVLQRRDAAVKAALRDPNLPAERMLRLLEEVKEISALLRGIGQRSEFDDEQLTLTRKAPMPSGRQTKKER